MKSRMASMGADPTKLSQWTWVQIEGQAGESTVFMAAYQPCKSIKGMSTVWNQHVRYYQDERMIEEPDVHALFVADLCTALGDLRDLGYNVVLGMDSNDNSRDGSVSTALADIGIKDAVINNHQGESAPATCSRCSRNTQREPIDNI